jgi:hypothetical protein
VPIDDADAPVLGAIPPPWRELKRRSERLLAVRVRANHEDRF